MKKILFVIFVISSLGCKFTKTYKNRESDKAAAIKVIDSFYNDLSSKNYNSAVSHFEKSVDLPERQNEILTTLFKNASEKFGEINKKDLAVAETLVTEGDKSTGEYHLTFYVIREKVTSKESFKMFYRQGSIKIKDYRLDPFDAKR